MAYTVSSVTYDDIHGIDTSRAPSEISKAYGTKCDNLYNKNGRLVSRPGLKKLAYIVRPCDDAVGPVNMYTCGSKVILRMGRYMIEWKCYPEVRDFTVNNGSVVTDSNYKVLTNQMNFINYTLNNPIAEDYAIEHGGDLYVYNYGGVFHYNGGNSEMYKPSTVLNRMRFVVEADDLKSVTDRDAPLLYTAGSGSSAGTPMQAMNMLSPCFRQKFIAESGVTSYPIALPNAIPMCCIYVTGGTETFKTFADVQRSDITFTTAPDEGTEILLLCYVPSLASAESEVQRKVLGTFFDERVFLCADITGAKSSRLIHSAADDPLYFPDNAYYDGFDRHDRIGALIPIGKYLAVAEIYKGADTLMRFHYPQSTETDIQPRIYPSEYSVADVGLSVRGCAAVFDGIPLILTKNGLMRVNATDLTSTASVTPVSTRVNSEISAASAHTRLITYGNMLILSKDGNLFVAVGSSACELSGRREYDWYKWTDIKSASGKAQDLIFTRRVNGNNTLFMMTAEADKIRIYTFEEGADYDFAGETEQKKINSVFRTCADSFENKHENKTLLKRGCGIYADGNISLSVLRNPLPNSTATGQTVTLHGGNGAYTFRPPDGKFNEVSVTVTGTGKVSIGAIILTAETRKLTGGKYGV